MFVVLDIFYEDLRAVYGPFETEVAASTWVKAFDPTDIRGDWFVKEVQPISVAESLPVMEWRVNPALPPKPGPGVFSTCDVHPIETP